MKPNFQRQTTDCRRKSFFCRDGTFFCTIEKY